MRHVRGEEPFHCAGEALPFTVADFWGWAAGDLIGNALRGLVAEFLVARAIGAVAPIRVEWDAVDLHTKSGTPVEVKCSGYVQSWSQRSPSRPSFDIAPKRGWDAATNAYSTNRRRGAELYVFALHHHLNRATADPCDVSQWSFHVVPTVVLNATRPDAKRLSLRQLEALARGPVEYHELASRIAAAEEYIRAMNRASHSNTSELVSGADPSSHHA